MKTGVIYKITSPTGKIYIGKAVNFAARYTSYRNRLAEGQPALHNSFLAHGFEAHSFEILETNSVDKLAELEIKYIQQYNSFAKLNENGLNLTKGGDGSLGRADSEEVKEKRASSHRGTKRSEETRKRMSLAAKDKPKNYSPEELEKKRMRFLGNTINLGRKQSPELAAKRIKTMENKGEILQLNDAGELVKKWPYSFTLIAKSLECNPTTIRQGVLSNGTKKLKGYYWKGIENE
jgi:group I intron endonuclease